MPRSLGFAFGVGLFGAGVSWVYIALSTFGEMPEILAAIGTAGFCAYLALFPAFAGWMCARLAPPASAERLATGRSGVDDRRMAAGLGAFRIRLAVGRLCATRHAARGLCPLRRRVPGEPCARRHRGVAGCTRRRPSRRAATPLSPPRAPRSSALFVGAVVVDARMDARPPAIRWPSAWCKATSSRSANSTPPIATRRSRSTPICATARKGTPDRTAGERAADVRRRSARPNTSRRCATPRSRTSGDLLLGLFFFEPRPIRDEDDRYFNSVVSVGTATTQRYRKHHLVPFGETIPGKAVFGWFIRNVLAIPLADQTPGPAYQAPFEVAGERVAVNICYEDAFGGELARRAAEATMFVNVTNDAWYGRSLAAEQHEQIAAMRALETGAPDAARDQYRHHLDHRSSRRRSRAPALVHARRARGTHRGPHRRDSLCSHRRRAGRASRPCCSRWSPLLQSRLRARS